MANNTIREVYLASQHRSYRKLERTVRMTEFLRQSTSIDWSKTKFY